MSRPIEITYGRAGSEAHAQRLAALYKARGVNVGSITYGARDAVMLPNNSAISFDEAEARLAGS